MKKKIRNAAVAAAAEVEGSGTTPIRFYGDTFIMEKLGLSLCVIALVAVLSACGTSSAGTSTSIDGMDYISSIASSHAEEDELASVKDNSINDMIQLSVQESSNTEDSDFTTGDLINLETECIKIYCDADAFMVPAEITDVAVVDEIVNAIDVRKWSSVGLENENSATPAYYIDFCNGTVLSMLSDTGYGSVGTDFFTEFDDDGNMVVFRLENADGPYLYNDGLYDVIQKVMAEYQKNNAENGPTT